MVIIGEQQINFSYCNNPDCKSNSDKDTNLCALYLVKKERIKELVGQKSLFEREVYPGFQRLRLR